MLLNTYTYTPFHYKDSWLLELVSCSKHSHPHRCPTPERFTSCLIWHICLHLSDIPQAILISFISSNFLQSHFHINRCVWSVYYVMVSLPKHFQEQLLYENRGQSVLKLQKRHAENRATIKQCIRWRVNPDAKKSLRLDSGVPGKSRVRTLVAEEISEVWICFTSK